MLLYILLLVATVAEAEDADEQSELVQPPKYVQKLFQKHSHPYTRGDGSKSDVLYSVFEPNSLEPNKKYPLLVWLHGAGQRSINNTAQLRHVDETIMPRAGMDDYPIFVLAPQCRPEIDWSSQDPTTGEQILFGRSKDMLAVTNDLIDQLIAGNPINPNRVVLMGLSDGGTAAWEMAERYPKKFAAVMPFGSLPSINLDLDKLSQVRIWAFHSPLDRAKPPERVFNLVSRLKAVGAPAELTFACDSRSADDEALNHYCFRTPFEEYDLFSWILAQDRSIDSLKPGIIQWSKRLRWSYLERRAINSTPFIIGAVITVAIIAEVRRRKRLTHGIKSTPEVNKSSG